MNKKRRKKKKKKPNSLLTRLFKKDGKKDGKKGGKKKAAATGEKARPLTRRQRSVAEIKQMKKIGDNDPARLANILSTILGDVRAKEQAEKEKLDELVWDIIHKKEQGSGQDEENEENGESGENGMGEPSPN